MQRLLALVATHVCILAAASFADDETPSTVYRGAAEPKTAKELYGQGVRETLWRSPDDEAAGFHLPPGFQVNLFASEPMIAKPLNMAWDYRGRLWVTSTVEYPYPAKDPTKARDKILILEDTNKDGSADKVTTFAEGLNIPMGLLPMHDGVIAFNIPNIIYFRDTNGDDRADQQEILLGPFDTTRDTHGMINAMRIGGDGWIYACHGFNNQSEVTDRSGHTIQMHSGNTFRFTPDGQHAEIYSRGQVNPFGMTRDEWGNWYSADCHSKPITSLLRGGCYPSFGRPHDGLGFAPSMMDHLHGSTAISGLCYYQAEQFPPEYRHRFYSGNVMTSRINCNALRRQGATAQAEELPDFMTSDDPWFRPVDIRLGPDGGLYVADFYNKIIGHYEVPLTHPGRDRTSGRIWRITHEADSGTSSGSSSNSHAGDGTAILLQQLSSSNNTLRQLAVAHLAQLTKDRSGERARILTQVQQFISDRSRSAEARIASAEVLVQSGELSTQIAEQLIKESEPLVAGRMLRILANLPAERRWPASMLATASDLLMHQEPQLAMAAIEFVGAGNKLPAQREQAIILRLLDVVSSSSDLTLRHAARIAARDLLRNESLLEKVHERLFASAQLDDTLTTQANLREAYIGILPSLNSQLAASKLLGYAANLQGELDTDAHTIADGALQLAKQFTASTESQLWLQTVEKVTDGDPYRAADLLVEFVDSYRTSGAKWNAEQMRDWLEFRDSNLLDVASSFQEQTSKIGPSLSWRVLDASARPLLAQERRRTDGRPIQLWSSFPLGEQHIGRWQSEAFTCPDQLTFWIAGHNGQPPSPDSDKNFVRIVDVDGAEIFRAGPPRNDAAHKITWQLAEYAKSQVRIEVVDDDDAGAYAWLAVGDFSVASLNPGEQTRGLATMSRLIELPMGAPIAPSIQQILCERIAALLSPMQRSKLLSSLLIDDSHPLAARLVRFASDSNLEHLIPSDWFVRERPDTNSMTRLAEQIARHSDALSQRKLTADLLQTADGCRLLVDLLHRGIIGTAALGPKPDILPSGLTSAEKEALLREFSSGTRSVEQWVAVAKRLSRLDWSQADSSQGQRVFETRCANCHQLGGKGAVVGPQLDGAIKRSRQRLAEDILAPNFNVDLAFRTTSLLLDNDSVVSGLITSETDSQVTLVQGDGKPRTIPVGQIVERKQSDLSLMPSGLAEQISDSELVSLLHYLTTFAP